MRPSKFVVLVRIDYQLQRDKKEKTLSGIYKSQRDEDQLMRNHLQWGTIIAIGSEALKHYPHMQVGDVAMLDHKVEDKTNTGMIVETLDNGDPVYAINPDPKHGFIRGIIKLDGNLIPSPHFVVVSKMVEPWNLPGKFSAIAEGIDAAWWLSNEKIQEKIADLTDQGKDIGKWLDARGDPQNWWSKKQIYEWEWRKKKYDDLMEEKSRLTDLLNAPKFGASDVLHINEETIKEYQRPIREGDRILFHADLAYPLEIIELYLYKFHQGPIDEEAIKTAKGVGEMLMIHKDFVLGILPSV
jgi:hypothetical protein